VFNLTSFCESDNILILKPVLSIWEWNGYSTRRILGEFEGDNARKSKKKEEKGKENSSDQ
jgi:hypothetical protein